MPAKGPPLPRDTSRFRRFSAETPAILPPGLTAPPDADIRLSSGHVLRRDTRRLTPFPKDLSITPKKT